MGQDTDNPESNVDPLFARLAEVHPARTDIAPLEGAEETMDDFTGSLAKRMQQSPKLSDMQVADKRLFPILKESVAWLSSLQVARVFPETYLPLRNIIVKHLLSEFPEMSVAEAIVVSEVSISIAIEGEGRIDELALFGRSSEAADDDRKNKVL